MSVLCGKNFEKTPPPSSQVRLVNPPKRCNPSSKSWLFLDASFLWDISETPPLKRIQLVCWTGAQETEWFLSEGRNSGSSPSQAIKVSSVRLRRKLILSACICNLVYSFGLCLQFKTIGEDCSVDPLVISSQLASNHLWQPVNLLFCCEQAPETLEFLHLS